MYLKAVRPFVKHLLHHAISSGSPREWDRALANFMDDLCYLSGGNVNDGSKLLASFTYIFPELKENLPLADRSLVSWQRLSQANEGEPISLSAIFLIALRLLEFGLASAAFALLLPENGYLREDDWENLLVRDVSILRAHKDSPPPAGLLLGPSEQGGTTKTGPDQGVIVDTPHLRWWIYYLAQLKDPEGRLVTPTSHEFREIWWRTLDDLGLTYLGPPHNLRHSRPSADASAGLDLESIRRRDKWASLKSVQRYTKGHLLIKQTTCMGQALHRRAEAYLQDPGKALAGALSRLLARTGSASPSSAAGCPLVLSLSKAISRVLNSPYQEPIRPAPQTT